MIDAIKEYFSKYPKIKEANSIVGFDYLPNQLGEDSYAIYATGDTNGGWVKKWLDGTGQKQFTFVFASRFTYSPVAVQNIQNSNFYIELQNWIEKNNKNKILPNVQGAISIEIVQTGVLSLVDESQALAEYQMTARLNYDV